MFNNMGNRFNYMGNNTLLGRIQKDNMYSKNENLEDEVQKLKINNISDPTEKQKALEDYNKSKSGIGNTIKRRFDRMLNTI